MIANQLAGAIEATVQFNEVERFKNQLTGEKLYLEEEIQSVYNFQLSLTGDLQIIRAALRSVDLKIVQGARLVVNF